MLFPDCISVAVWCFFLQFACKTNSRLGGWLSCSFPSKHIDLFRCQSPRLHALHAQTLIQCTAALEDDSPWDAAAADRRGRCVYRENNSSETSRRTVWAQTGRHLCIQCFLLLINLWWQANGANANEQFLKQIYVTLHCWGCELLHFFHCIWQMFIIFSALLCFTCVLNMHDLIFHGFLFIHVSKLNQEKED